MELIELKIVKRTPKVCFATLSGAHFKHHHHDMVMADNECPRKDKFVAQCPMQYWKIGQLNVEAFCAFNVKIFQDNLS